MAELAEQLPPLVVICGPTAAGKTDAALALAECFDLEVISADSRQVYRGMDIGTAKPTAEERARVPHHLLDVVWPHEPFDAARFATLGAAAIDDVLARGRLPVLVGGTGLYIRALTEGLVDVPGADPLVRHRLDEVAAREGCAVLYQRLREVDPAAAALLHPNDRIRIVRALEVYELSGRPLSDWQQAHGFRERRYRLLKIALAPPRDELYQRIDSRARIMFETGLIEETQALLTAGYDPRLKALQTIGYREAFRLIEGQISREVALAELQQATRRYAKRQLTWFRADSEMIWVDSVKDSAKIHTLIAEFYEA